MTDKQYLHAPTGAAWTPFLQALLSGIITGIAAGWIAEQLGSLDAWSIGLAFGLAALLVMWVIQQKHIHTLTSDRRSSVEIWPTIQEPAQAMPFRPHTFTLWVKEVTEAGHVNGNSSRMDVPSTPEKFRTFARAILQGDSFSRRKWTGQSGLFSDDEYRTLQRYLVTKEFIVPKVGNDPHSGYILTEKGKTILTEFLHSPTPDAERGWE
jgi:hypothetical protein